MIVGEGISQQDILRQRGLCCVPVGFCGGGVGINVLRLDFAGPDQRYGLLFDELIWWVLRMDFEWNDHSSAGMTHLSAPVIITGTHHRQHNRVERIPNNRQPFARDPPGFEGITNRIRDSKRPLVTRFYCLVQATVPTMFNIYKWTAIKTKANLCWEQSTTASDHGFSCAYRFTRPFRSFPVTTNEMDFKKVIFRSKWLQLN